MKKILFGLAGGALLALAILPSTRWVLKMQVETLVQSVLGMPSIYSALLSEMGLTEYNHEGSQEQRLTAVRTIDVDTAMSQAARRIRYGYCEPLRDLVKRFPNEPAAYGAFLRYYGVYTPGARPLVDRRDYWVLERAPADGEKWPPDPPRNVKVVPSVVNEMKQAALRGQQRDPDNAFFPMMLAFCYYGEYHDEEGDKQVLLAGRCSSYDDYARNEIRGGQKALEYAYVEPNMMQRMATVATLLYPQYGQLRTVGRIATYRAMKFEIAGDIHRGVALRMAVLRCGSVMRKQSPVFIGSQVGMGISYLAASRPGGSQITERVVPLSTPFLAARQLEKENRAKHYSRFQAYLGEKGFERESQMVYLEFLAYEKTRSIIQQGASGSFNAIMLPPMLSWAASSLGLAVTAVLTLLWLVATWLSRLTGIRDGRSLPTALVSALLISALMSLSISLHFGRSNAKVLLFTALLCLPVVWLAGRRTPVRLFIRRSAAGTLVCTIFLYLAASGVRSYPPAIQFYQLFEAGGRPIMVFAFLTILTLAVPGLVLLVLSVRNLIRRRPAASGVVMDYKAVGPYLICVMVFMYAVGVTVTARNEAKSKEMLFNMLQHEGRFTAETLGQKWPD